VAKAEINIPWLPMRVIVSRVARHLGCAVEHARLRIIQEAEAGRVKACGLTVEGWPMSPLSAAWRGVDRDVDVDLRLDALIAADLLPAPAERARWPAMLALAYIIEGMPLEGKEWTAEMVRQTERAEIDLGQAIGADQVPAWGRRSLYGPIERIPDGDFRAEMVAMKVPPVSATRLPKAVVRVDGNLGISPAHRIADYRGPHWSSIECDVARLKQAFPEPLRVERRMLGEAEQLYAEGGSEPAARAEESMPEPASAVEPAPAEPPQAEPPAESAKPAAVPHPGGRPPVVNWKMVGEEVFRLMNYHNEFSVDDPEWNAQARLEEAIAAFCEDKFNKRPSETAIKDNIREPLERWRQSRLET
jgi:hypothetical protein